MLVLFASLLLAQAPDDAGGLAPPKGEVAPAEIASARLPPMSVGIDGAIDLPLAALSAMPSVRADADYQLALPLGFASVGVRAGYSYGVNKGAAVDPALGVDPAAYLVAHRVPIQVRGLFGMRSAPAPFFDVPARVSLYGAGGVAIVSGEAHGFGRTDALLTVAPAVSVGSALELELGPTFRFGAFGEWDGVAVDLGELGAVGGDLSSVRLGLRLAYSYGS